MTVLGRLQIAERDVHSCPSTVVLSGDIGIYSLVVSFIILRSEKLDADDKGWIKLGERDTLKRRRRCLGGKWFLFPVEKRTHVQLF